MLRNFFCWAIQCLQRVFDFRGRACRREVWSYSLLVGIAYLLLSLVIGEAITAIVMFVLFIIPGIASCVRRLHDINLSGKWLFLLYGMMFSVYGYLIYIFVNFGMMADQNPEVFDFSEEEFWQFIVQYMPEELVIILILLGVYFITNIIFLILMLLRGTIGENKYGLPHDYIDRDRSVSK